MQRNQITTLVQVSWHQAPLLCTNTNFALPYDELNAAAAPIHPMAMWVILTEPDE